MRGEVELDPDCRDKEGPPSRTRSRLKKRKQQQDFPLSNLSTSKQTKKEFDNLDGVNQFTLSPLLQTQSDKEKPNCMDQSTSSEESKAKGSPKNDTLDTCTVSTSSIPDKQTLELILDVLQRRDTFEIFAEPVDSDAVEDYYVIITEPMDFGTMRAKLHEGLYKTLEQFEHDVFLISRNAMHFNSSGTTFFRQARAINELSKKVFHVLKTEPENFIAKFSGTTRRSSRRPQSKAKDLNLKPCNKVSKTEKASKIGASSSSPSFFRRNRGGIKDYESSRDQVGGISASSEPDRRSTYQPWASLHNDDNLFVPNVSTNLEPVILQRELSYRESLMMFVKDLGPTAQMIAKRKLNGSSLNTPSNYGIPSPLSLVSSSFASKQIKPSTLITSSSQKSTNLFPWTQTTQSPAATGIIHSTKADEEEKDYDTSKKMGNFINEATFARAPVGSYSPALADKPRIFGNSSTNSDAVTLALAAESRRKNSSLSLSSWLDRANQFSSLSQSSSNNLNSHCQATSMVASTAHNLEPNSLIMSSASGFTFDVPFLQSQLNQMNNICNDSLSQQSLKRGFKHQEEPTLSLF